MNSLADILNQKADELFDTPSPTPVTPAIVDPPELTPITTTEPPTPVVAPPASSQQTSTDLRRMIYAMKDQLDAMLRLIDGEVSISPIGFHPNTEPLTIESGERIVEGAFTGEKMLGDDGKEYSVPPNYASKSKLVSGDRMKLTITKSGSFIFKQIGPVERKREIGTLTHDPANTQWAVQVGDTLYRVLTASVTFYKGNPGDEAIILIPRDQQSSWGAVDNIITSSPT